MNTFNLISYKQLFATFPQMGDNPFICKHYRRPTNSPYSCISSAVRIHNETANIWTHLFPSVIALVFMYYNLFSDPVSFQYHSPKVDLRLIDRLFLNLPLMGNFLCFGISTVYHCFTNHVHWACCLREVDFLGIAVLNCLHSITLNHFKFYHHSHLSIIFSTITILTMVGFAFILKTLRNSTNSSYQVKAFALVVIIVYSPSYLSYNLDFHVHCDMTTRWMMSVALGFCTLGGVVYSTKFPEVLFPGRLDLIGNSHNLLHVFSAIGMFCLYQVAFNTSISVYQSF